MDLFRNACLAVSRFALGGWVCASVLFVVTTVQEIGSPEIEALTKSHLADLRFPIYYLFGFTLLTTGLVTGVIGCQLAGIGKWRSQITAALVVICLLLMVADKFWIYGTLREMTADPRVARPAEFVTYHRASMQINSLGLLLAFVAAAAISWPRAQTINASATVSGAD